MKKFLFVFLILNLFIIKPVLADETSIEVYEVRQGENTVLQKEDDTYIVNDFGDLKVMFELYNLDESIKEYTIVKESQSGNITYSPNNTVYDEKYLYIYPEYKNEIEEYTIKICNDWNCEAEYARTTFKLKYMKYNEIKDSRIIINSITQGGKEIVPNEYDNYVVNNRQDIHFNIKGENLLDDEDYIIYNGMYDEQVTYKGSELEQGVTYIYNPNNKENFYLTLNMNNIYHTLYYKNIETEFQYYYVLVEEDTNFGDYEANLIYTNYKNELIEKYYMNNNDFYIVNSKYHDSNNTLSYKIEGSNYQNKDYNINLDIKVGNKTIYSKNININGLTLNKGYQLELNDLKLENDCIYTFYIEIDGISNRKNIRYINKEISINSITQNDKKLSIDNGVYIATEFGQLVLSLNVDSLNDINNYYITVNSQNGGGSGYTNGNDVIMYNTSFDKEVEEYTINVCDDWECNKLYAVSKFRLKYSFYQKLKNSKVIISNLKQAGKIIELDDNWNFNVNDKQDLTYTIKGENLFEDEYYSFYNGRENIKYLGSELEQGVEFTYYLKAGWGISLYYYIAERISFNDFYYYDGNTYYHNKEDNKYISFVITKDNDIKDFTSKLTYNNSNDNVYDISPDIYNKDKILNILINGDNYEDKNYNLSINITYKNKSIYTDTKEVNGLLLNNDYKYVLKNVNLEKMGNISSYDDDNQYHIYLSIDNVTNILSFHYKYEGMVFCDAYYGEKELTSSSGSGETIGHTMGYTINPKIINDKITLKYKATNLVESRIYNYEIRYEVAKGYDYSNDNYEVIKTGKMSGADLMNSKLNYDIYLNKDLNNSYYETYSLVLKYDDSVIYMVDSIFRRSNVPMITSLKIKYNNKELEDKNEEYQLIKENDDIILEFKGEGFEDDKDYYFNFDSVSSDNLIEGDTLTNLITKEITIKGQELNNGYSYTIHYDDSDKYRRINYGIRMDKNSASIDGGNMYINYVNYNDFIKDLDRYHIEDSIFKYVNKNTRVLDLINRIKLYDNATLKVFDKTNSNEINSIVGTGMILKLYNNDNNLFDFKIVVKGDVSGDGNISVTDLVKVKKHLSYKNRLTDIYELAGDVTSDDNISITDLVRMAKDVAEIESLS